MADADSIYYSNEINWITIYMYECGTTYKSLKYKSFQVLYESD